MTRLSKARGSSSTHAPERILIGPACAITGLPRRTLLDLSNRGCVPGAAKLGQRWTFNEKRLRQWISDQEATVADGSARIAKPPVGRVRGKDRHETQRRYEAVLSGIQRAQ